MATSLLSGAPFGSAFAGLAMKPTIALAARPAGSFVYEDLLTYGQSAAAQNLRRQIVSAASSNRHLLIRGASDQTAIAIASAIHARSSSCARPQIWIDCRPEFRGHLERLLFGPAGQEGQSALAMERATVVLHCIEQLPLAFQQRLSQAITSKSFHNCLGDRKDLRARLIGTSDFQLNQAAMSGQFRRDLLAAISMFTVRVPTMLERAEDVAGMIQIIADHTEQSHIAGFSPDAVTAIEQYSWRSAEHLLHVISTSCAIAKGPLVLRQDLPPEVAQAEREPLVSGGAAQRVVTPMEDLERLAISEAIEVAGGNRTRAAQMLGIGKTTLYRKLKEWKDRDEQRGLVAGKPV